MSRCRLPPGGPAARLALTCALAAASWPPIAADAQERRGAPIAVLLVAGPYVTVNGRPAASGMAIASGDRVVTGPSSSARLNFYRGGSVQLDADTDPEIYDRSDPGFWQGLYVELRDYLRCVTRVIFNTGQLYAEGESETSCVSHGPETMIPRSQFNLQIVPGQDVLTVVTGEVALAGTAPAAVPGGTQVVLAEGRIVAERRVGPEELRQITAWRNRYAFAPNAAPPPPVRPPRPRYPTQPYPTQPYPTQPYPTQPYPTQPYPTQPIRPNPIRPNPIRRPTRGSLIRHRLHRGPVPARRAGRNKARRPSRAEATAPITRARHRRRRTAAARPRTRRAIPAKIRAVPHCADPADAGAPAVLGTSVVSAARQSRRGCKAVPRNSSVAAKTGRPGYLFDNSPSSCAGWPHVPTSSFLGATRRGCPDQVRAKRTYVVNQVTILFQRTGAHSTSSMSSAPVASVTSRSKPSAIPAAGGIPYSRAARKSSSIG